jgi:hypothetical protein
MVDQALWLKKCTNNLHEDDGLCIDTLHQLFCGGILG